jgi:hypothetical protein
VRAVSKYRERSPRTSSASRDSDSGVNPTRSAKRTETRRRSTDGTGADPCTATSSGAPHSPQKRSPGSFAAPQAGQATASGVPHWAQNFRPDRFACPHAAQRIPRQYDALGATQTSV